MAVQEVGSERAPEKNMKTGNKNDKKVYLVAQELKLARVLAGNNKTSRDRALKSLKKWFAHRSKTLPFTDNDFQRIWKGLYFSMWMSDKPLIQEECAESISSLIHFETLDESLLFFKSGLTILINEWFGIDQLRLDKFLMLVRRLLRQMLVALKRHGLSKRNIQKFGEIISYTILNSDIHPPVGLFMHFTEIYLEEIAKITQGNLPSERVVDFIQPYVKKLLISNDGREIAHIRRFIFNYLMRQSDVGIEYQLRYEAWKKAGFPGTINSIQKIKLGKECDVEEYSDSNKDNPLDPRAGRVDVELPQIKFKPQHIINVLVEHKFDKNGSTKSRKTLNELVSLFTKLSHGVYPLGVKKVYDSLENSYDTNVRKAANRLIKFENKLLKKDKKKRKRNTEDHEEKVEVPKKRRKENRTKSENINQEETKTTNGNVSEQELQKFIAESEGNIDMKLKNKKKMSKKQESSLVGDTEERESEGKPKRKRKTDQNSNKQTKKRRKNVQLQEEEDNIECMFERNSGTWVVYDVSKETEVVEVPSKPTDAFEGPIIENEGFITLNYGFESTNYHTEIPNRMQSPSKNGPSELDRSKTGLNPVRLFESPTQSNELFPKSSWDEPLEEGEYEICIPSKKHVAKLKKQAKAEKKNVPKLINTSLKRIRGKSRLSLNSSLIKNQFSTPGSTKKVKINTKLNMSQEIHEHVQQILSSPGIPYDANKKPSKPLLKTSVSSTPINPFYNKQLSV